MDERKSNPMLETVCGSAIQEPDKYPSSLYRGEVVYFCTGVCLRAFERDPDRFIAGEIEHPEDDE